MKKIVWHCFRGLWFIKLGMLLIIALALLATRIAINELPAYRGQIQQLLEDRLEVPVKVGLLRGSWQGFNPAIAMENLYIGSGNGALVIKDAVMELDSIASLRSLSPVFRSFRISQLEARLKQNAVDNSWQLVGFDSPTVSDAAGANKSDADKTTKNLVSLFLEQSYIEVSHIYLNFKPVQGDPVSLLGQNFQLLDKGEASAVQLMLQVSQGQPVNISAEVEKSLEAGNFYLQTSRFRPDLLQGLLPSEQQQQFSLAPLHLGTQIWGRFDPRAWSIQGNLNIPQLQFALSGVEQPAIESLSTSFSAQGFFNQDRLEKISNPWLWQVAIEDLGFKRGEYTIEPASFYLAAANSKERQLTFAADRVDLAPVRDMVLDLPLLEGTGRSVLETLNPEGQLEHITLRWSPLQEGKDLDFDLSAGLKEVSVAAWEDAPSGAGVNGQLRMGPRYGYLDLDTENFSLGLPELFRDTWHYQLAKGRLAWELTDGLYRLDVNHLKLKGEEGDLSVALQLDIPFGRLNARPISMKLAAGLKDGDGSYTSKYLPARSGMSPALVKWLDNSIKAAFVNEGAYMMNGPLSNLGYGSIENVYALFFDVKDAELDYDPAWPRLKDVTAMVVVDPDRVDVTASRARLYKDTFASHVDVSVPGIEDDKHPLMLHVKGDLKTSGRDGLTLLRTSPVATLLGNEADKWNLEGRFDVGLKLDIPLDGGAEEFVRVDVQAENGRFTEQRQDLDITDIQGDLFYDSKLGLVADELTGKLWNDPLQLSITTVSPAQKPVYQFKLEHETRAEVLKAWLPILDSKLYSGELNYSGLLAISADEPARLMVSSKLQGTAINLPPPFGKKANDPAELMLDLSFASAGGEVYGSYLNQNSTELAKLALSYDDKGVNAVSVGLGGSGPDTLNPGFIRLQGKVSELNEKEWSDFIQQNQGKAAFDVINREGPEANRSMRLEVSQLQIDKFRLGDTETSNISVSALSQVDGIDIQINSEQVRGSLLKPYKSDKPWQVVIDRLQLVAEEGVESELWSSDSDQDALADMDPAQLPAMNVTGSRVNLGTLKVDTFSFKTRPQENGVQITDLNLQRAGAKLEGTLDWYYLEGAHNSQFSGQLETGKIGDLLRDFGHDKFMVADRTTLSGDLRWSGSPAYLNASRLEGNSSIDIRDGRFPKGSSTSALRIFGVLNIDSIMRRLKLDFSDLYRSGLSFDRIKGETRFDHGVISFPKPLEVTGPSSDFILGGSMNLPEDRLDMELAVTLPVTENLPLVGLLLGQPQIAGAIYLFDKLLGKKVQQFASLRYKITGSLDKPDVELDRVFSDKVKKG
ncbi:YhdP family protein [Endozoicomonadaceae bacterium StTr2]